MEGSAREAETRDEGPSHRAWVLDGTDSRKSTELGRVTEKARDPSPVDESSEGDGSRALEIHRLLFTRIN